MVDDGLRPKNQYFNPAEKTISVDNAAELDLKWAFTVRAIPRAVAGDRRRHGVRDSRPAASTRSISRPARRSGSAPTSAAVDRSRTTDGFVYVHTMAANLFKLNAEDGTDVWGPIKTYDTRRRRHVVADRRGRQGDRRPLDERRGHARDAGGSARRRVRRRHRDRRRGLALLHGGNAGENGAMVWSTVSVDLEPGVVYAGAGNNYTIAGANSDSIHAIDLVTGEQLWTTQVREGDVWSISIVTSAARHRLRREPDPRRRRTARRSSPPATRARRSGRSTARPARSCGAART